MRGPHEAAAREGRLSDLRVRTLSAAVLVPLALGALWTGGWPWLLLVAAFTIGVAIEWIALCGGRTWNGVPAGGALILAVLIAGALAATGRIGAGLLLLVGAMALLGWLTRRWTLAAGVPYFGLTAMALVWLRRGEPVDVLFLLLVVWASDVGAYLIGRLAGGPALAAGISPGKTWSGALGGLLCGVAIGLIFTPHGIGRSVPVAFALALAAQIGDLAESAMKRGFGVKDSGRLIPGHGGLLDRLDGLLAAAPVAAGLSIAGGGLL